MDIHSLIRKPVSRRSEAQLIDALKQTSELLVWGDQHSEQFFECVAALPCGVIFSSLLTLPCFWYSLYRGTNPDFSARRT